MFVSRSGVFIGKIDSSFIRRELHGKVDYGKVISLRSLPRYEMLKSNAEIQQEIIEGRRDGSAKFYDGALLQWKKARAIFKFFQAGITNVWRVNRDLRTGVFRGDRFIWDYSRGDKEGKFIVKRRDYKQLIDAASERVSLLNIENKNGNIKRSSEQDGMMLSRKEFIEIVRDSINFKKLPLFGFLFLVFEELSFPLIYIFPKLLPTTCILPGMLEKRYFNQHVRSLEELERKKGGVKGREEFIRDIVFGRVSPYSLSEEDARLVYDHLCCHGPATAATIVQHLKTVLVDDYLLLRECGWDVDAAVAALGKRGGDGSPAATATATATATPPELAEFALRRGLGASTDLAAPIGAAAAATAAAGYLHARKADVFCVG